MKKDIHPGSYRLVVFRDISTDEAFLGKSCTNSKEMVTWEDGKNIPSLRWIFRRTAIHSLLVK